MEKNVHIHSFPFHIPEEVKVSRRLIDISNQNELTLLFIITDQKKYLTQKTKKNKEGISLYDKKFIHVNYVTRRKPGIS